MYLSHKIHWKAITKLSREIPFEVQLLCNTLIHPMESKKKRTSVQINVIGSNLHAEDRRELFWKYHILSSVSLFSMLQLKLFDL